jgi:hypothetical protein
VVSFFLGSLFWWLLVWFGLFFFFFGFEVERMVFFCLGEDSCVFHLAFLELRDDGGCLGIIRLKCEYASHLLQMRASEPESLSRAGIYLFSFSAQHA